jgi:Fe-S-cluster containining protein
MTPNGSFFKNDSPEVLETECRQSVERLLREIHSPASLDDLWPEIQNGSVYQNLFRHFSSWTESYRERQWEALCREMEKAAYATRPYCLRCGDCCRQGSPTLYFEDLPILRRGVIKRMDLLTLRSGEVGLSNETRELVLLAEERIKVKEKPGGRECFFLEPKTNGCRIYEDRPLQCRVMECWNPDHFQDLETQTFLSRKALLNPEDPLIAVIETHSKRCAMEDLQRALSRAQRGFAEAEEEALDILFFDEHLRRHLEEEKGINRDNQLFLFGRPVSNLITSFGFRIEEDRDGRINLEYRPRILKEAVD